MTFGQYTDDTQLTRELMLSLVDEGAWVPEDFADRIARIFSRDGVVGYGGATMEAAVRLMEGASWDEAGTPPPRAGNGAAMRATPMGLFFWDDLDGLVKATMEQAVITHKASMSVAAAVAVAAATAMCLNASKSTSGPHEPGWWQWLARFVERCNEEYAGDIRELADMVFKGRKGNEPCKPGDDDERRTVAKWVLQNDDAHWSGVSPWARTSVLWSLYCLMSRPRDPWGAIELAVWVGGDSDTIAAMAGAMVGAIAGYGAFPSKAIEKVVPLVHDAKAEEYGWNGLDRIVYFLYGHIVRRYNESLDARVAEMEAQNVVEIGTPEEVAEATEQKVKAIAHIRSHKAKAPDYVATTKPVSVPEPESKATPTDDEGDDILSMFGRDGD
jgi:ADP-ribosylglycohydrolase